MLIPTRSDNRGRHAYGEESMRSMGGKGQVEILSPVVVNDWDS